jgi:PIN domain nuclease of toxin-antitoxin system
MNYLLDTHTFLWFINADASLNATAQTLIEDGDNDIFLSVASLWEMAIKVSLGKLEVPFYIGYKWRILNW